jgi:hypothetical protein
MLVNDLIVTIWTTLSHLTSFLLSSHLYACVCARARLYMHAYMHTSAWAGIFFTVDIIVTAVCLFVRSVSSIMMHVCFPCHEIVMSKIVKVLNSKLLHIQFTILF